MHGDPLFSKYRVWIFACLALFNSATAVRAEELRVQDRIPRPAPEIFNEWVHMPFSTDEMWRFRSRKDYEQVVDASSASPQLKEQLKRLYTDEISDSTHVAAHVDYPTALPGGYVLIPTSLRKKIPQEMASSAYQYMWHSYKFAPRLSLTHQQIENDPAIDAATRQNLLKNLVKINGKAIVPIAPYNWDLLPLDLRSRIVDNILTQNLKEEEGLRAQLFIKKSDDLAAIARKYAGGRDPRPIERYLRRALGSSEFVRIPLENILPPIIRKMIDKYSPCHGPNCYNSALSTLQGHSYQLNQTKGLEFMDEAFANLRFVRPHEALQVGDLFLYTDLEGNPVHATTYVGGGLVFNKGGMTRYSPYVFQTAEASERYYFPRGSFHLVVLRKPGPAEQVASLDGGHVTIIPYETHEYSAPKTNSPLMGICAATWNVLLNSPKRVK